MGRQEMKGKSNSFSNNGETENMSKTACFGGVPHVGCQEEKHRKQQVCE